MECQAHRPEILAEYLQRTQTLLSPSLYRTGISPNVMANIYALFAFVFVEKENG